MVVFFNLPIAIQLPVLTSLLGLMLAASVDDEQASAKNLSSMLCALPLICILTEL